MTKEKTKNASNKMLIWGIISIVTGIILPYILTIVSLSAIENYSLIMTIAILSTVLRFLIIIGIILIIIYVIKRNKSKSQETINVNSNNVNVNAYMTEKASIVYFKKYKEHCANGGETDLITQAKIFAQSVELHLLKSPATAIFSPLDEMSVEENNGVYSITGYVDSANSYGAIIRTPFTITAAYQNGQWVNCDRFISTSSQIRKKATASYVLYIIIGLVTSLILFFIFRTIIYL